MTDLIKSHNELLTIVQAYAAVNEGVLDRSPYLKHKIKNAITTGIQTKKSAATTTDS
ncbi:hypothetical protein [Tenacibaculum soleae]|uniref:hypothetical protein n=1 Tax=Tenacibaculum soleae TaxID=447689 RepID=UPI0026E3A1E2|nr:hypothetical protein [Tenacibaculum soleae]MDO6813791.1 hypothetical protein [Tenacibaculum soleae]